MAGTITEITKMAKKGLEGMLFTDTITTLAKDSVKDDRQPGQSDVSYGASKAIPYVTTAIGGIAGEMGGGLTGALMGSAVGARTGVEIEQMAQERRAKVHHVSMPTSQSQAPSIPSVTPQPIYIIYGGPGAGVPQYPHEPVIYPKRGRSHKTHRRGKTSR